MGARSFSYSEFHYFGNPGYYQTYVFTAILAAWPAPVGRALAVQEEVGGVEWPDPDKDGDEPAWEQLPETRCFREQTVITSLSFIGAPMWERNYPTSFGPHGDEVRTIP